MKALPASLSACIFLVPALACAGPFENVAARTVYEPPDLSAPVNKNVPANAPVAGIAVRGKVKESSKTGLFDGVTAQESYVTETVGGTVLLNGVGRFEKQGDLFYYAWSGACATADPGQKTESVRCAGGWRAMPGSTGRYATLTGAGVWRSQVMPDGTEANDWEGFITR